MATATARGEEGSCGRPGAGIELSHWATGLLPEFLETLRFGRNRAKKSGLVIAARAATSNPVSQVLW